jgi:hypothetical protein
MPFGTSKGQKTLLFLSLLLFFIKKINYIAKDAILCLKSSGDARPSYFLISPPSRHTPNTMANLLHAVGY